jgi:hypothetical protein
MQANRPTLTISRAAMFAVASERNADSVWTAVCETTGRGRIGVQPASIAKEPLSAGLRANGTRANRTVTAGWLPAFPNDFPQNHWKTATRLPAAHPPGKRVRVTVWRATPVEFAGGLAR